MIRTGRLILFGPAEVFLKAFWWGRAAIRLCLHPLSQPMKVLWLPQTLNHVLTCPGYWFWSQELNNRYKVLNPSSVWNDRRGHLLTLLAEVRAKRKHVFQVWCLSEDNFMASYGRWVKPPKIRDGFHSGDLCPSEDRVSLKYWASY